MTQLVRISDFQARKAAQEQLGKTPSKGGRKAIVVFSRIELKQLLAVYSRHVIAGDWKAYAIDHGESAALFGGRPEVEAAEEAAVLAVQKYMRLAGGRMPWPSL